MSPKPINLLSYSVPLLRNIMIYGLRKRHYDSWFHILVIIIVQPCMQASTTEGASWVETIVLARAICLLGYSCDGSQSQHSWACEKMSILLFKHFMKFLNVVLCCVWLGLHLHSVLYTPTLPPPLLSELNVTSLLNHLSLPLPGTDYRYGHYLSTEK